MIPDLSVLWVILFVLLLVWLLDRLLFSPVQRIVAEREGAIQMARKLAEQSADRATAAAAEFEEKTQAARADLYRAMDDQRRKSLERRAELLAQTRREVETTITEARLRIETDVEESKNRLTEESERLGATIVRRILGGNA